MRPRATDGVRDAAGEAALCRTGLAADADHGRPGGLSDRAGAAEYPAALLRDGEGYSILYVRVHIVMTLKGWIVCREIHHIIAIGCFCDISMF